MSSVRFGVAVLSLALPALGQQTLVVGPTGSYSTIGAAIAAAVAGDTVLVQPGDYQESLDVDKGIRSARELLLELGERGLGVATEVVEPAFAPYLEDLLSFVVIGARPMCSGAS